MLSNNFEFAEFYSINIKGFLFKLLDFYFLFLGISSHTYANYFHENRLKPFRYYYILSIDLHHAKNSDL